MWKGKTDRWQWSVLINEDANQCLFKITKKWGSLKCKQNTVFVAKFQDSVNRSQRFSPCLEKIKACTDRQKRMEKDQLPTAGNNSEGTISSAAFLGKVSGKTSLECHSSCKKALDIWAHLWACSIEQHNLTRQDDKHILTTLISQPWNTHPNV